jgi:large conductance mechanosensitive channel
MIRGFKEFLLKNNVVALAIAVILGVAVGKVVTSLAQDIIMPLVSPILPSGEWRTAQIMIGPAAVKWGSFLGNLVDFVIIAFIVYLMTKALIKEVPPAPTKTCPRCLEAVAPAATKCKFCTTDLVAGTVV